MSKRKNGRVSKGDNGRHLEAMGRALVDFIKAGQNVVSRKNSCWAMFEKEVKSGRRQLREAGLFKTR